MIPADENHRIKNNQRELFRPRLEEMINLDRPLAVLAGKINWKRFEVKFGALFSQKKGRPAIPTRVVVGLLYLKQTFNLSDEEVLLRFEENPYWQYFCGFSHFNDKRPCDPSVLSRWRKRIGEEGLEELLSETLAVAHSAGHLKTKDLDDVNVDTTVQEKNIAFPTDAKLLNRARETLVREAKKRGIQLRQTYKREGKYQLVAYSRYCHARQFKRAKKPLKRLKTILGRVIRDFERKCVEIDDALGKKLVICKRVYSQKKNSKDKLYSIHEPGVECISKGKAHKRYEFGCKVSIATTNKSNWVVGAKAFHGRPYDGHTFEDAIAQSQRIIGKLPARVYADKGYRGAKKGASVELFTSGQKRGVDKKRKKLLLRRAAVEPVIGHLKSGHRLSRNFLKGIDGDKNNAVLAGIGFNLAKLLAAICFFFPDLFNFVI